MQQYNFHRLYLGKIYEQKFSFILGLEFKSKQTEESRIKEKQNSLKKKFFVKIIKKLIMIKLKNITLQKILLLFCLEDYEYII